MAEREVVRETLAGDRLVRLEARAIDGDVRLEVIAPDLPELRYAVAVTSRPKPAIASDESDPRWGLWRGIPRRGNARDPFFRATRWAYEWMFPGKPSSELTSWQRSELMRRAHRVCRWAAVAAAARCEPEARRAALRFCAHVRWFVYDAIVRMPTGARAGVAWLRAIKAAAVMGAVRLDGADRARLAGFASANGAALHRLTRRRRRPITIESLLGELLDWAEAAGRVPSRRTSLPRIVAAARDWHAAVARAERIGCSVPLDQLHLPPPPLASWAEPGLTAEALVTVDDLVREGHSMRSCIASRLPHAASGARIYYRVRHAGRRATVELSRCDAGWAISEAAGFANSPLGAKTLQALERLAAAVNRTARAIESANVPAAPTPSDVTSALQVPRAEAAA